MHLTSIPGSFSVCRLPAGSPVPGPPASAELYSLSITASEISVVCATGAEPAGAAVEGGWSAMRVAGTLDFGLVGILAALTAPLAEAGIPVFCVSTYDTDYLLLKADLLERAREVLAAAGHDVYAAA
ncbi:ACT domain-containing protein [Nonomuraea lactucae]|uniref:ACT domain-containing protein n=1 Tax=Nonomuraea lactucae TaxID=2249762 RepID=UPI000DE30B89|nr:ACT domain-containing protein [Nonomuraea lactucae]